MNRNFDYVDIDLENIENLTDEDIMYLVEGMILELMKMQAEEAELFDIKPSNLIELEEKLKLERFGKDE